MIVVSRSACVIVLLLCSARTEDATNDHDAAHTHAHTHARTRGHMQLRTEACFGRHLQGQSATVTGATAVA